MKIKRFIDNFTRRLLKQDGNVAVLTALLITGLLGMTAVVVDGGTLYATKMHLQKTANATVLSGAQELTNTEASVRDVANHILYDHGEELSLQQLSVAMKDRTTAKIKKDVTLGFSRVLGIDKAPVSVKATAELVPLGAAIGAAPIAIEDRNFVYNQEYTLKVDNDLAINGNFGIIDLPYNQGNKCQDKDGKQQGSDLYECNLMLGYQQMLSVGDVVTTKTGNVAGNTLNGVEYRLSLPDPYANSAYKGPDCPRVLLIPVYTNPQYNGGQLKEITISGFAKFYLSAPFNKQDKEIRGTFMEGPFRGTTKPGAINRGAYAIKLTE